MKANARSHSIVSAAVIAQPEVSTLSDAGEMCAFVTPLEVNVWSSPYSLYQYQWDSCILPVNAHKPLISRWYPVEGQYQLFNGQEDISDDGRNISYRDFQNPNIESEGVIPFEIGVVCTGMTPSTGVVRFQIVVNYEFIPLSSTAMISTEPSPIDPMEEQLVNEWMAEAPVTEVISQRQASKAPTDSHISEESEPSGFGMLFNVIEEMVPFVKTALPLLL